MRAGALRSRFLSRLLPLALALGVAACSRPSAPAPVASRAPVASSGASVLSGNVPPIVRRAVETGRVDPTTELTGVSLLFRMSPLQKAASHALLTDLYDAVSPRYHRWLTPSEVAASFGATRADVERATAWLAAEGFTVHGPSPTRTRLLFSGTVGQLEQAFQTEVHRYDLDGAPHFALAVDPSVPTDLSRSVLGLRGVHDFQLRPLARADAHRNAVPAYLEDAGASGDALELAPADFATIYDISTLYAIGITGSGQEIGVIGACDFNDADITAFRTDFGLDTSIMPVRDLVPLSGSSVVTDPDYFGETELDLEWSGAVAKEASLHYVYTGNNPAYGPFDSIVWAIEEGSYPVLTVSYASCEEYFTPSEDIYLESMGDAASMEGITVVNASGDWGPASCDAGTRATAAEYGMSASWPASIPSFTAVGGTMFSWGDSFPEPPVTPATAATSPFDAFWTCSFSGGAGCSPLGYVPETAWNEIAYDISSMSYFWGAGGGGTSTLFSKPYWQVGTTPTGTMRTLPDVSISAAWQQVGYVVSQSWTKTDGKEIPPEPETLSFTGGTSAAAPSFAGILALVNQALARKHPAMPVGLGNANPALYALAASTSATAAPAFHDITTGDTMVPCKAGSTSCPSSPPYQFGFSAGAGYDLATGLGSVDVNNLVAAWTSLTPTSTTLAVIPSGALEGATAKLTATVASVSTATALTGSVVFYVDTVDEGGLSDLSLTATGALIASLSGGVEGGTATATVAIPPGVLGQANVVAFYGGDAHYLASWSVPAAKVLSMSTLAVSPAAITVSPDELQAFTTTGGVAPVAWSIVHDSACNAKYVCSRVESLSATVGIYKAGPDDGTTTIAGIDSEGAEVRATISVTGPAVDGGAFPPPWDGGAPAADAGGDGSGEDAQNAPDARSTEEASTADVTPEAAPPGAAPPVEIGDHDDSAAGCGCRTAGHSTEGRGAGLAGLILALATARRKRSKTQAKTRARSHTTSGVTTFGQ